MTTTTHARWGRLDDAMKLSRTAAPASRIIGYEGPPNANAGEACSKWTAGELEAIDG